MHHTFLSCDWGTTSFRLRLIEIASGKIIASTATDEGIATIYAWWKQTGNKEERVHFFTSVIQKNIQKIEQFTGASTDNIPVIISGMASSTIGMLELPYTALPFSLTGEDLRYKKIEKTSAFLHDMIIISGASSGSDVIRGEETQLVGCAGEAVNARQVFIFTGTHSKHITTAGGKAVGITTYMTGEFFDLLSKKSILSDSVTAGAAVADGENKPAFEQGIKDSLQQNLLHYSFRVRTNQLFRRFSTTENYFYLSGLLIGTELNHLPRQNDGAITVVGDKELISGYLLALAVLGIGAVKNFDATTATISGQLRICRQLYAGGG